MRLPRFEYLKPASVEEALSVLQEYGSDARMLAGGTDLLVNMKLGLEHPGAVVSIRSLPELCAVTEDGAGGIRIGAGANLSDLARSSLLSRTAPALHSAVAAVASQHIRNMASIGGNLCCNTRCWYYNQSSLWRAARPACYKAGGGLCHAIKGSARCHALNCADTAPALVALNARIVIRHKDGERTVTAREFYQDNGSQPFTLTSREMVTRIDVPNENGAARSLFLKISRRRGIDFALGSIAAVIVAEGRTIAVARLVLGALGSAPLVLEKTGRALQEGGLSAQSIEEAARIARTELGTLTNVYSSAGYKRDLAQALVRRVLGHYTGHA